MRKIRFLAFIIFCGFVFITIPVNAQTYNQTALDFLKRSIECLLAGDYSNAIINCNEVIRRDPNSALNYVIRGRAYYELKDYERAIADFTQAIRLDRNNFTAFTIRGNAHRQRGDIDRAIADWEAALRINPDLEEAKTNLESAKQ